MDNRPTAAASSPGGADAVRPATANAVGSVTSVTGAQASIALNAATRVPSDTAKIKVGKFLGIWSGRSLIIGWITEIVGQSSSSIVREQGCNIARVELVGEIKANGDGVARFRRGITEYPSIGDSVSPLTERELRLLYGLPNAETIYIGALQQDAAIDVQINIDDLLSKHFAVLGTTGVGKSSGVAIILQQILEARPNLRIFLVDPHNEYGHCFGEKAQVLTPRNLRLPFWLFNFEETIDAFFGGRPGIEEEVEILAEVIPVAKSVYTQYQTLYDRNAIKKRDSRNTSFTGDTPVPYRIEDLIELLDERMGKLENRASRNTYHKLIGRIRTFRNHPRYGFMFDNANIGGDTMAEVLAQLFRLSPGGQPMTIMQMAGFPAEVVDSVVSVLCRMAFDFGLWSDGIAPLLFVCEEAHRYAPANSKIGFGPTRRALSRIAKEGRKYGVFLGLITQRPSEIDPAIISQCSTLFVMRMSNDHDQALIRSAVSDAAGSLLTFIPSLGTREVFVFGPAVAIPTRLTFKELPPALRPSSEAAGNTASDGNIEQGMIESVIERWRSATMSKRMSFDDEPVLGPNEAAPLQPAPAADPQRFKTLRKPLQTSGSSPLPGQP